MGDKISHYVILCMRKLWYGLKGIVSIPRLFLLKIKQNKLNQVLVIGDSHTIFFTGLTDFDAARKHFSHTLHGINIPRKYPFYNNFLIFHLGGSLAYNAMSPHSSVNTFKKTKYITRFFLKSGGGILCSFGEVDIRAHVIKQMKARNLLSYKEVVDEVIERYLQYLCWIKSKKRDVKVYVWAPIASISDTFNTKIDMYGNERQRNEITRYFNQKLQVACEREHIIFLCLYDKLVDEEDRTLVKYFSADGIHLNSAAMEVAYPLLYNSGLLSKEFDAPKRL